jgi:hypothetical protein
MAPKKSKNRSKKKKKKAAAASAAKHTLFAAKHSLGEDLLKDDDDEDLLKDDDDEDLLKDDDEHAVFAACVDQYHRVEVVPTRNTVPKKSKNSKKSKKKKKKAAAASAAKQTLLAAKHSEDLLKASRPPVGECLCELGVTVDEAG